MTFQIAFVKTNQEIVFRDWLARHEVESYLPISKIQVKPRGKRRFLCIERAIFPHYVFLKVKEGLDDLVRLHTGFLNWLRFGDDDVSEVTEGQIEVLKQREATGEFDKMMVQGPGLVFQKGTKVKVMAGPFAGFVGTVDRPPKRQAIAKIEINGKIVDCPLVILALAL